MSASTTRPIAFFLPSLSGGGAERVVMNLANGMVRRGLPVDLILASACGPLLGQLASPGRLVDLGGRRVLRSLGPLVGYLRRERPRALIASLSHANLVALWAARLAGRCTPVTVTVHNTMSESAREQGRLAEDIWPHLLRRFYPWAAHVVAVSGGAADDLARSVRLPRESIEVIYNPVINPGMLAAAEREPGHPWFQPGEPPVVLGVGRMTAQKNFPLLIRAFAEVRRCRSCRLMILGEGEGRRALEALVRELELTADVALPGFRDDAMACMARSGLFVLSSAWEGLPTVLIEALAVGTPVVSTDCPSGPREILQDGRLGALVPMDDVAALAGAILDGLSLPAGAGAVAPDALEPFTERAAVDHYLRLVESS